MVVNWIIGAVSVFAITCAALVVFLAHRQVPVLLAQASTDEGRERFLTHHRRLHLAVFLVAMAWVLQCAALFFT